MKQEKQPFIHEIIVDESHIDENHHVNNVVYIQWMQNIAILHSEACGGTAQTHSRGCSWVIRSHNIEYLHAAFLGDTLVARTWVVASQKVRHTRRYSFHRKSDGKLIAKGETDWVYVDKKSLRPVKIPPEVSRCYILHPDFS